MALVALDCTRTHQASVSQGQCCLTRPVQDFEVSGSCVGQILDLHSQIQLNVPLNAWKDVRFAVGTSLIAGMPGTGFMPPDGHAAMCQRALQQRLQALHCSAQPSMSGRALHPEPVQRRKPHKHGRGSYLQCAAVAEMDPVALDATRRGAVLGVASVMPVTPVHQLSAHLSATASL